MGPAQAKASGRAAIERMKAMPTEDDCFGPGRVREDGRKIHPVHLFEVKPPAEVKGGWDLYRLAGTIEAALGMTDEARAHLRRGLATDPGMSPWQRDAARTTLAEIDGSR